MELGIALDGEGHLGRPGAVSSLATAADSLGYSSVWCLGPWAASLAGAVTAVTSRVRIAVEPRSVASWPAGSTVGGGRLVVAELRPWTARAAGRTDRPQTGPLRLDTTVEEVDRAQRELRAAHHLLGGAEVVVRLVGDPTVDQALAAYAELGELAERSDGSPPPPHQR